VRQVRISGLPGAGAVYYATRLAAAEVAAGKRVIWINNGSTPRLAPGVETLPSYGANPLPEDVDLAIVEAHEVDASLISGPSSATLLVVIMDSE
jgi:hypothetical protein